MCEAWLGYLAMSKRDENGPKKPATIQRETVSRSLARQAARRKQAAKIVDLAAFRQSLQASCPDGATVTNSVLQVFHKRGVMRVDLAFLEGLEMGPAIAEGVRLYAFGKSPKTVAGRTSELRIGIASFLREQELEHVQMRKFDRAHWLQFMSWLDKRSLRDGTTLHAKTRALTLGALSAVLDALLESDRYRVEAQRALEERPHVRWSMEDQKCSPRERLSREHLVAIDAAAEQEIRLLRDRVNSTAGLLQQGRLNLELRSPNLADLSTCLAYVMREFPNGLPHRRKIKATHPELYAVLTRRYLSISEIQAALYPSIRDLVPIIVRLAIDTALNVDSILQLTWSGITNSELLGVAVKKFEAPKRRAAQNVVQPVFSSQIDPLLDLVKKMTQHVRGWAPPSLSDRVLLYKALYLTEVGAFSLDADGMPTSNGALKKDIAKFCQDHHLASFTLAQIRPTLSDEVAQRRGVVVASNVLGHTKLRTTEASYVSDGTRWREREALGRVLLVMARWRETGGVADPRRRGRAPSMDIGAATPGFLCFDPYDSPIAGQRKGRLCTAYGLCPSCPMAAADIGDPLSIAMYLALARSIYESQGYLVPEAWRARYAQVLVDLQSLLSRVRSSNLKKARQLRITLPRVE